MYGFRMRSNRHPVRGCAKQCSPKDGFSSREDVMRRVRFLTHRFIA